MKRMRLSVVKFIKKSDHCQLTMELFTKELVSDESAQLFTDNTLSSFTNFLQEQLNLEGQFEVALPEISCSSMYQNVAEAALIFYEKKVQSRQLVLTGTRSLLFHYEFCWNPEHSHCRKTQPQQTLYHNSSNSMDTKI